MFKADADDCMLVAPPSPCLWDMQAMAVAEAQLGTTQGSRAVQRRKSGRSWRSKMENGILGPKIRDVIVSKERFKYGIANSSYL
jgi:hypothetical protein